MTASAAVAQVGLNPGKPASAWWAWVPLGMFFLCGHAADAVLGFKGLEMPEGAIFLLRFVSLFLTWQWLDAECRPSRQTYPLDMGMFIYAAAVVVLPYYMWRNQRWRGLLKIGGMMAMWGASYVLAYGGGYIIRALVGE